MHLFGIGRQPVPSVIGDIHHSAHHAFAAHVGIGVHDVIMSSHQAPQAGYLSAEEKVQAKQHNWWSTKTVLTLEAPRIHPLVHCASLLCSLPLLSKC